MAKTAVDGSPTKQYAPHWWERSPYCPMVAKTCWISECRRDQHMWFPIDLPFNVAEESCIVYLRSRTGIARISWDLLLISSPVVTPHGEDTLVAWLGVWSVCYTAFQLPRFRPSISIKEATGEGTCRPPKWRCC